MGWKSVLLKLMKLREWFRANKMYFAPNLFSCFVFPHRKFHFTPEAAYAYKPARPWASKCARSKRKGKLKCDENRSVVKTNNNETTRVLRLRKISDWKKSLQRSSPINVIQTKLRRKRRKTRSDFERLGLYDLEDIETGEFRSYSD